MGEKSSLLIALSAAVCLSRSSPLEPDLAELAKILSTASSVQAFEDPYSLARLPLPASIVGAGLLAGSVYASQPYGSCTSHLLTFTPITIADTQYGPSNDAVK